jgi:DNA-binding response OmpR family regulator
MRILIVEDDPQLAPLIKHDLEGAGYVADIVGLASDGLHAASTIEYDVLIVDLTLPDGDGMQLVHQLRSQGSAAPILILTARSTTGDKVKGLSVGADDYLVKPFDQNELKARVAALLRRSRQITAPKLLLGDIEYDVATREVTIGGAAVSIPRRELALLELLLRRSRSFTPKDVIEERLYGFDEELSSNAIEVHIHHLRKVLANAKSTARIETSRGLGYRLSADK